MPISLCIVQFDRSAGDPEVNRQKMLDWLGNMDHPADIILLPEDWLGPLVVDGDFYTRVLQDLQGLFTPGETMVVSGAQYVKWPERTVSTGAFIGQRGMYFYEKFFPSLAIGERDFITPGDKTAVVRHRGTDMGAVVCVDLFYPEITRSLALAGATLVLNPASIPASRIKLWHSLGITRAAENTVFLAMANNTRTRYPDGREVSGGSFLAGPDGKLFRAFGSEPGLYRVDVHIELLSRVRERWAYLADIAGYGHQPLPIEHYNINHPASRPEKG